MSKEELLENGKYEKNPKLFITNLPPDMPEDQLKTDIQPLFEKFGAIKCVNVKKHKSGQYSYCFLEFEKYEDAIRAIQEMDQKIVHDRPMKVRQDRQGDGCFNCKKSGHFAKQCPLRDGGNRGSDDRYRRRSRDRNDGYDSYRSGRRDRQRRSRSRSSQYRDRGQKKHRRQRSRSRDYSPYDQYRRDHHRRRYRHSKSPRSRSPSDSYDRDRGRDDRYRERERDYRRRDDRDRDRSSRRENRQYRRSRSSSYDQRRGGR